MGRKDPVFESARDWGFVTVAAIIKHFGLCPIIHFAITISVGPHATPAIAKEDDIALTTDVSTTMLNLEIVIAVRFYRYNPYIVLRIETDGFILEG